MRTGNNYTNIFTTLNVKGSTSIFEHHEYMVFRYVAVELITSKDDEEKEDVEQQQQQPPTTIKKDEDEQHSPPFTLTAWTVQYPYFHNDSSFISNSQILNDVWNLCQNTIQVTSLDTTTDSNTRERLPYEADGFITGASRLALQREYQWIQHSWRHNIVNPTWPTEWRQTIPLFAEMYYMQTGNMELYQTFQTEMEIETQYKCTNSKLHLIDFNHCNRQTAGLGNGNENNLKDIVDWPVSSRDGYIMTNISNVINSYAIGGLKALLKLEYTQEKEEQVNQMIQAMNTLCMNGTTQLYTDGYDNMHAITLNHSSFHANIFPVAFNLTNVSNWPAILQFLTHKGMAGSVYSSYWALKAAYNMDIDHGVLAMEWMTSCNKNSWCNMIHEGATATMEAWSVDEKPNLSWSHPWATAPTSMIVQGVFGIQPLTAKYETFICKPQVGDLLNGTIKIPILKGFIDVEFVHVKNKYFKLKLKTPVGTIGRVCLDKMGLKDLVLIVDGIQKIGVAIGDYVCIDGIGSSSHGRVVVRGSL